eukprot:m.62339 g.62339  ORF g.62339 m.62339 type:complete len:64 (-) comp49545_c0_seq1:541-732(-)
MRAQGINIFSRHVEQQRGLANNSSELLQTRLQRTGAPDDLEILAQKQCMRTSPPRNSTREMLS